MYSLHRRKAVIILFPFRYGICEITSHMCPARAAFDIRQIVITLVSVGLQISTEPMQERCCMELCPCLCVMIEQDRRKPIFSTAEEPHPGICFRIALRLIQYLNPSWLWATVVRLILLDFASYLIYYTRKKVTYELLTHEYNYWR